MLIIFHYLVCIQQTCKFVSQKILHWAYIDDLLVILCNAGVGCYFGNFFIGALSYADDVVLIAPLISALHKMLAICDSFATDYCISFNTKKSKCLAVFPRSKRFLYAQLSKCVFYVDGKPIEFVKSYPHLGHIVNARMDDTEDISYRRVLLLAK